MLPIVTPIGRCGWRCGGVTALGFEKAARWGIRLLCSHLRNSLPNDADEGGTAGCAWVMAMVMVMVILFMIWNPVHLLIRLSSLPDCIFLNYCT